MSDEYALHRDLDRGARAEALINNELLVEAFDRLQAEYTKGWLNTAARDTDARERLWQALQILGQVREHLKSVVRGGVLARAEIDQITELQARRDSLSAR